MRSGAGKTTLAMVAGGLIEPDAGRVLPDGVPPALVRPARLLVLDDATSSRRRLACRTPGGGRRPPVRGDAPVRGPGPCRTALPAPIRPTV
ncbi:hypothetical protein ACFHW2_03120 [Actinomadura sp. LOL_016]|uniref:hypothetical protein n=1 Tax=unclassified Actinomadura TaxID=2626254 RepID=UPI003A7FD63B